MSGRQMITRPHIELAVVLLVCISIADARAQDFLSPLRTAAQPHIDGMLDDSVWSVAPHVTGFVTYQPDFGKVVEEQTDVRMAYDRENLYFGVRCYDPHPDKIKTSVSSRDNMLADDWFCINLDSFGDQQGLYCFYINPAGIQADSRFSAGREDFSLDLVWYSAGKIDSSGYTLEIQIPLKSIRYRDSDPVEMGVVFERYISRRSEHSTYPTFDPAKGGAFLTQMKKMVYHGVKHYTLLEILPAFTYSEQHAQQGGAWVNSDQEGKGTLTMKYGLTSDLILDGTYNPDFSQVESDAEQVDVNLRYSLFYPEKRPFFLEGKDNFEIAATQMSDFANIDPVKEIVHTRTIVNPVLGTKLSGKIGERETISSLYALDNVLEEDRDIYGRYVHYPVVRYKHTLSEDSYIGGMFAGREFQDLHNNVVGVDDQIRVGDASMIESSGFLSESKSDPSSSPETGHTLGLRYHYDARDIEHAWSFREISESFHADMGYVTRTGIVCFTGLVKPKIYPASDFVQLIMPSVHTAQTRDDFSGLWETYNHVQLSTLFRGNLTLGARYVYSTEIYQAKRFQTSGLVFSTGGQFTRQLLVTVSFKKGKAIYYDAPSQGSSNTASASLLYQPSDKLQLEGSFVYSDFTRDADHQMLYRVPIGRGKLTYQVNQSLFFRGIVQYNDYQKEMLTDFLASFTSIPGTVVYLGYGSLYDRVSWNQTEYVDSNRFLEMKRAFFFKTSYLWRL